MTKIGNINLSINLIDKGSNSAFLFMHGLQSRKETFDIYLDNFSPKTKRSLISLDLIGFGQSDKPKNFGYDLLDQVTKIKDELSQNFKAKIKLDYKYDKSLIGGLVIQVGSIMVDTSIKNKLQQIENTMIEA